MDVTDAKTDILENVFLKTGTTAIYLYDFGDGWRHRLELIEISNAPQSELLTYKSLYGDNTSKKPRSNGPFYTKNKYQNYTNLYNTNHLYLIFRL